MIEIQNLCKNYRKKTILSDMSLQIPCGVFGLIGSPKSGKSTLLKILATLEAPTAGDVYAFENNLKIQKNIIKSFTGFLPQNFDFFSTLSVAETMSYLFDLKCKKNKIPTNEKNKDIDECLSYLNLKDEANTKIAKLSPGMKKRLGIAQAFLHDPKVVILDEPAAGLEVSERIRFLSLLSNIKNDRIVIMSTTRIKDIKEACNNFAVLQAGSITYSGNLTSYADSLQKEVYNIVIKKEMLPSFIKHVNVISLKQTDNKLSIRYMNITDDKIKINNISTKVTPTVTDAYAYYTNSWITEERLTR